MNTSDSSANLNESANGVNKLMSSGASTNLATRLTSPAPAGSLEAAKAELAKRLAQLDQLRAQFVQDELAFRQQLVDNCQELRADVAQMEAKQNIIRDCLRNVQSLP